MRKVNAVVVTKYGGPEVLEYTTSELSDVKSTEVLIKVKATSVNFADIKARTGKYHNAPSPPFIPGLECAGIVESMGENVKGIQPGQHVIALPSGSYAEYVKVDHRLTYPISNKVKFDIATAFPIVTVTSYNMLNNIARVQPNEVVLVHGAAGGVGTTAIQVAKLLGANKVIGTVGSNEKGCIARQAGADHVVNYHSESFHNIVNQLTDGRGADVILDSYSGNIFEQSLKCLARFGRIVNFGNGHGSNGGKIDTQTLHSTCRSVLGYSTATYLKHNLDEVEKTFKKVISFIENDKISMFISKKFGLKNVREAHQYVEDRKSMGKVILELEQ